MKYLIIILSLILLILAYNSNFFKSGFKFENYTGTGKNTKLTEVLRRDHPVGSDGIKLKEKLEKAGAKCWLVPKKDFSLQAKSAKANYVWMCNYTTGLININPLHHYNVWLFLGEDRRVIFLGSSIEKGIY